MYAKRMGTHADRTSCEHKRVSAPPFAGFAVLAIGLGIAYYVWPSEIGDVPLASLTFGTINQAIYAVCLALMAWLIAGRLRG
jgi:hypothetical protein